MRMALSALAAQIVGPLINEGQQGNKCILNGDNMSLCDVAYSMVVLAEVKAANGCSG